MPNIEEHLKKAIEDGKFDDLPGKGKPLRMDENPHEDEQWRLAFHILSEGGFSLPWIEAIKEIGQEIERARADLQRSWNWRAYALEQKQPYPRVQAEWQRAVEAFRDKVKQLNKRIRDYNLQTPTSRFQRPLLNVETEIKKLTEHPGESAS
jgi:DnaJ family protein C protein 28